MRRFSLLGPGVSARLAMRLHIGLRGGSCRGAHDAGAAIDPPLSYSMDSTWPPTDPRFIPPVSGYSHWTDNAGVVHVIYAPDVHLPLPPAYQRVDTMGVREAVAIAVAAEEARRAAGQPGSVQLQQPQEPGSPVHPPAPPLPPHLQMLWGLS